MTLKVDFKVKHDDNRGIYYSETERCVIYLPNHETLEDIYKTITHELIHFCLDKNHENENMDEDMEERLVFCLQWAEYSL
jgi:Zn-dependent peptidase ImmA (M78 family)|tara:strand:+ start:1041 stop:1280 length:240 start_codon:yes stop_codon:yes gene_type:complete